MRVKFIIIFLILIGGLLTIWFYANEKTKTPSQLGATKRVHAVAAQSKPRDESKIAALRAVGLPQTHEPLKVIFDDLKTLADAGDKNASCRLGVELTRCRWYSGFVASKQKVVDALSSISKDDTKYIDATKQIQHLEKLIAKSEQVCKDFPEAETVEGWRYILSAASAGDGYSAVRFAEGISLMSPLEPKPLENIDGWQAYKQNAAPLLEQALAQGYPQAAFVLSRFYRRPQFGIQLVQKDPIKSVAYMFSVKSVANPEFIEQLSVEIDYLKESLKLNDTDMKNAEAMGVIIASKFRNVPKSGVDFRNGTFEQNDGSECK